MKAKRFSSLDKVDSSGAATQAAPAAASVTSSGGGFSKRPRKYSLERDVYYFENNRREEVRLEACRTIWRTYGALYFLDRTLSNIINFTKNCQVFEIDQFRFCTNSR